MWLPGPALALGGLGLNYLAVTVSASESKASAVGVTAIDRNDRRLGAAAGAGGTSGDSFAARTLDAPAGEGDRAQGGGAMAHSPSDVIAASPSRKAYATLLYSDFVEGTRALGQSLRESGTSADTVVLVTPDVRQQTREKLAQDGWM